MRRPIPRRIREHRAVRLQEGNVKAAMTHPTLLVKVASRRKSAYLIRSMRAIRVHESGGAEKLILDDVPVPEPKAGEVRVRVGRLESTSSILSAERALSPAPPFHARCRGRRNRLRDRRRCARTQAGRPGGKRSGERRVCGGGDRACRPIGAHSEGVSSTVAAALLLQGLTAHYLACDTFALKPGDTALVHAAAGGVGLLLVQIAKRRGARVIGTAGSEDKARLAREAGAEEVVIYTRDDFAAAARRFNGRAGSRCGVRWSGQGHI